MSKKSDKNKLHKILEPNYGVCFYCKRYEDMLYAQLPSDPHPSCPYQDYKQVEGKTLCVNWITKTKLKQS